MATRKDEILVEYSRKLKELDFLWSNPLRPFSSAGHSDGNSTSHNPEKSGVISSANIEDPSPISSRDIGRLKRDLEAIAGRYFSSQSPDGHTKKRPAKDPLEGVQKAQKTSATDLPSRSIPSSGASRNKKAVSKNLQAQIASLEHETNAFLNKSLNDVDVVSLPEHLPTENHNVLSLAELYYLTQTLPLIKLLPGTHKTLMTENFESAILEGKVAVLFSRIEELKRSKKWSLRQPIRYYDPFVYAKRNKKSRLLTWDYVLKEGKWMAADFKESSKYKKLCCVTMAQAVNDFWTYGKVVCVKRKPIQHLPEISRGTESDFFSSAVEVMDIETSENTDDNSSSMENAQSAHGDDESSEYMDAEDPEPKTIDISKLLERPDPNDEISAPILPEYSPQDLANAGINVKNRGPFKSHVSLNDLKKLDQSILRNLPKFTAFDDDKKSDTQKPIPTGETAIVPVSRMLYPMEADDEWHKIILRDSKNTTKSASPATGLPEYQKGLFGVQSHRRLNFLRPPKPPLIKNIEFRSPTIWLPQDDKYLIHYVAEYCFNWDLIAENLQSNVATLKRYESNIERRTPWQCFERYIQLNEKFQFTDMKGINAYSAQQWLEHAHKAQSTTKRRISPLGVGNESIQRGHRRLRWASMFDAMRKTMRKRETAAAKANTRKNTNSPDIPGSSTTSSSSGPASNGSGAVKRAADKIPTPSELSKLKFDRDKSMQEAYMHQQATRSKMMAAVSQQKNPTDVPNPSSSPGLGGPTDMTGTSGAGAGQRRVSQVPSRNQGSALSSPSLQRPQATRPNAQQLGGTPQPGSSQGPANKQAMGNFKRPTTPNGTPLTVEQIQRLLQIQKQRRLIQQQQQQQQQNQAAKSGLVGGGSGASPTSQNPLVRKNMVGASGQVPVSQGLSSSGVGSGASSAGGSNAGVAKRSTAPSRGRMQFPPAQVSAIINSIQQKNPNLTKDQVTKLAASYLANLQQQQQNKLDLQAQQAQQAARSATAGESSTNAQQSLQARQAQLSRQRLAAQTSAGLSGKETDSQTLSKMQYEERKKLMMQQGGSQFGQSSAGKPSTAQSQQGNPSKAPSKSAPRAQGED
ncbi:hypothetical protein JCM33374_g3264 [Metschnikowia sp. JCM 33374]|nr:hypothetical protein JCM33374_g3264 [Metschnikowia sp. JCM 33374]